MLQILVTEHLTMYAKLKGVKPNYVKDEVEKTIDNCGLREKANFYPTQLSGGQVCKHQL